MQSTFLSKNIVIRDPLHNYIPISRLEATLIGDPLFQRLRYITQNGLAHVVYPSNRTSRFIHSLGAMHLGGRMFLAALANAAPDDRSAIREKLHSVVETAFKQAGTVRRNVLDFVSKDDDPLYRQYRLSSAQLDGEDLDTIVVFQAIRIACVMHDLGHFPLSHTLEEVIFDLATHSGSEDSASKKEFLCTVDNIVKPLKRSALKSGQLHEHIGRTLTDFILRKVPETSKDFARTCFRLASSVAAAKPSAVLEVIHRIVSGELDADRLDYVRRDGYASGFEFGDFDLERILSTVRFRISVEGDLELIPTTVAASALESFFLERYRIYEWLVFHPMVVRMNVAVQRALRILFEITFGDERGDEYKPLLKILERDSGLSRLWRPLVDEDSYEQFAGCDEGWLLTLLREVHDADRRTKTGRLKQLALKVYLDLVCDRNNRYLRPIWKRQAEYAELAAVLAGHVRTKKSGGTSREGNVAFANNFIADIVGTKVEQLGRYEAMRRLEEDIQRELCTDWGAGLIVDWPPFSPYRTVEVLETRTGRTETLESLSTIVARLKEMWEHEVRLRVFWWPRKRVRDDLYQIDEKAAPPSVQEFGKAFANVLVRWRGKSKR